MLPIHSCFSHHRLNRLERQSRNCFRGRVRVFSLEAAAYVLSHFAKWHCVCVSDVQLCVKLNPQMLTCFCVFLPLSLSLFLFFPPLLQSFTVSLSSRASLAVILNRCSGVDMLSHTLPLWFPISRFRIH